MAASQTPSPVSDSMANATTGVASGPNTGTANNNPVGSAGQPAKMDAIKRRLAAATAARANNDKKGTL